MVLASRRANNDNAQSGGFSGSRAPAAENKDIFVFFSVMTNDPA